MWIAHRAPALSSCASKSESRHPLLITTFTAGFTVFVFVSKSHPQVLGNLMSSSTASIFSFGRCPLQGQHRGLEIQCNRILITDLTAPTFLLRRLLGACLRNSRWKSQFPFSENWLHDDGCCKTRSETTLTHKDEVSLRTICFELVVRIFCLITLSSR